MNQSMTAKPRQSDGQAFDLPLGLARQSLYRFAALALADPRYGTWRQLANPAIAAAAAEAAALLRGEPAAEAHDLGLGERPLADLDPAAVVAKLPATPEAFNAAYEQTFGLLVSGNCPPYETEYVNSKFTFQRSHGLADIAGFYHAFGLEPSTAHPERPDHVALELEFMAFLLGLERAAAESSHVDRLARRGVCRNAQKTFLQEHLAWWLPTFARLLSLQDPGGFYDAVSQLLSALVSAERSLFGVSATSGQVGPSTVERPEECSGCLLNV
jgi:TorA maturation chaperone TorD